MRNTRFYLKSVSQTICLVAYLAFLPTPLCMAQKASAQIEEVLDATVETQEFPTWLTGSYFFKKNQQLLENAVAQKSKDFKTDDTSRRSLEDYQQNLAKLIRVEIPFRLFIFNPKETPGKIDGVIRRNYFEQQEQKYSQLFREALEIKKPESLSKYRWITFRFFDEAPDRVWIKSPSIEQARPVSWYLRSEPLFYSAIVAHDILGSSEKLSDYETAIEPNFVTIPAPISSIDDKAPPIDSLSPETMIPSFTVMLRNVIVAQLTATDPFAKIGQLKLLIDRATGIPIYKATLNRKGDVISILVQALPAEVAADTPTEIKNASLFLPKWGFKEILRPETEKKGSSSPKATILYGALTPEEKITWSEESFDPNL